MFANYTTLKCSCRLTLLSSFVLRRGRAAALAVATVVAAAVTAVPTIAAMATALATATGAATTVAMAAVVAATIAAMTVTVVAAMATATAAATLAVFADVRHARRRRVATTVSARTHVTLTLFARVAPSRCDATREREPAVREAAVEDRLRGSHQMHEVAVASTSALTLFVLTASER